MPDHPIDASPVNYYERHIGDYARDTGLLSMAEHGAYTLLTDYYYHKECGIPERLVYRVAKAVTTEDHACVDLVLREFFTLVNGFWIKNRIEEEIEKARDRIEAAKANGRMGGRPKKPSDNPDLTQKKPSGLATDNPDLTQLKAHQSPITNKAKAKAKAARREWPQFTLPDWIKPEVWSDYLDMRTKKRAPATDRAMALVVQELSKIRDERGHDPHKVLDQSIRNTWTDVYPLKGNYDGNSTAGRKPSVVEQTAINLRRGFQAERAADGHESVEVPLFPYGE